MQVAPVSVIVSDGSPVPVITLSVDLIGLIVGADGNTVSIVSGSAGEIGEIFVAKSVAVAVIECSPVVKGTVGVIK